VLSRAAARDDGAGVGCWSMNVVRRGDEVVVCRWSGSRVVRRMRFGDGGGWVRERRGCKETGNGAGVD
jgi:hypothetical protein